MNRTLVIAREEVRRIVLKRSFIFVLLSLPLFLALTILPAILIARSQESDLPIGYVDELGTLAEPRPALEDDQVEILAFTSEAAARQALDDEQIQAYYLVPANFETNRQLTIVYVNRPTSSIRRQFLTFLRYNQLQALPEQVAWRAVVGTDFAIRNPEGTRVFPSGGPPLGAVLPLVLGLAFGGLLMTGGGSLMSGVVDEKSNRTMEVLMTSVSAGRFVTGKLFGIILANLLQLIFWIVVGIGAIWLAGNVFDLTWFQHPQPDWNSLLSVAAVAVPSYVFAAALMFALGATIVDAPEGQSLASLLFLLLMAPIYALLGLAGEPHGTLAITLSLLPLTSILTIGMRNMLVVVPAWQVGLSALMQIGFAAGAIWLAGRAFRLGNLRYGQRLRLRELLRGSASREAER